MSTATSTVENEQIDRRTVAVVLRSKDKGSGRGTLLLHVEEQEGRLVPGELIVAVPVYPGQPGLDAALYGATMGLKCTQTICLGAVMLDLSPDLFQHVGAALQEFLGVFPSAGAMPSQDAD